MSRRWGQTPLQLRRQLTYHEFTESVMIERRAMGEEAILFAYGTHSAILDAIGGSKVRALQKFSQAVRPSDHAESRPEGRSHVPVAGHDISMLQHRVRAAVASGELA